MLEPGIYELIVDAALRRLLDAIEPRRQFSKRIDAAEASKCLADYLSHVVKRLLDRIAESSSESDAMGKQIEFVNALIVGLHERMGEYVSEGQALSDEDYRGYCVAKSGEQLLAILDAQSPEYILGKDAKRMIRPETSLSQSSLFTGGPKEPSLGIEIGREIASSDAIDMLVSFVKWSGLRTIIEPLRAFSRRGGKLRLITTSYMGATDLKAIVELKKLENTEIKISYDTRQTRLHAKAYLFKRRTGYSTAYVGSSNLSEAALGSGLEWNIKLTRGDLPEAIDKMCATFESYWNDSEFEVYTEASEERLRLALKNEARREADSDAAWYRFEIQPYVYQQEILDKLRAEREVHHCWKNLVVAATGTGKTVISAFDYKRFKASRSSEKCRLLFVAHREEILRQSLYTFRGVLKDPNFGEIFVGGARPNNLDHLFVSIQTLNSQKLTERMDAAFYDYIVVDEFHHAAAPSYQKLLSAFQPKIWLGLTATPERMDGQNISAYFDRRIAAEIRLPEAIERRLLCPFQYFGVTDTVDLAALKWSRGGYDKHELSNVYTLSGMIAENRAAHIVKTLYRYISDIDSVKGLGFCVSVAHARFMADFFHSNGIPSRVLTGDSPKEERESAQGLLQRGEIRFIFVVDLYNEGVDIPEVNTILFLRPTESLTVFLQQLGRGLRLSEGKACLTVLDFIGQANKNYRFEEKFAALMERTRSNASVRQEIMSGFGAVTKGCYIHLEPIAQKHILENIKKSYGDFNRISELVLKFEEESGLELTLENFLDYHHMDVGNLYRKNSKMLFGRMCANARGESQFNIANETQILLSLGRLSFATSRRWLAFLIDILPRLSNLDMTALSLLERRMLNMFYTTVYQSESIKDWQDSNKIQNLRDIGQSGIVLDEYLALLRYKYRNIDFVDEPVLGDSIPLDLYCTYTRDQILVALDFLTPKGSCEGVKWLPEKNLDVFFITLNKSEKAYSPTTLYQDYSINERLFHWQSQSTTTPESAVGQRYIHHAEKGSRIALFVRENKVDATTGLADAYTFLGLAQYVEHSGSRPMSIVWQLERPIPAKFLFKTNKLLAG